MTIIFVSVLVTSDSDSYYTRTYNRSMPKVIMWFSVLGYKNIRVAWIVEVYSPSVNPDDGDGLHVTGNLTTFPHHID